jgi:magnesium transporter
MPTPNQFTAGKIATDQVPIVRENISVAQAESFVTEHTGPWESLSYIYIIDQSRRLVGVLSMKELFNANPQQSLSAVMKTKLITAMANQDREEAAHLALRHKIKSIPVVSAAGVFLGAITEKQILETMYREKDEDLFRLAGVSRQPAATDRVLEMPIWKSLRHRLPWLVIGLAGGIFAATIISFFEETLQANLILASFIPLLVYISDAVGTQMEAFIIRDHALEPKLNFSKYFWRQFWIVVLLAALLGAALFIFTFFTYQDLRIAIVLASALFAAVISAVFTGLLIPYIFIKLRFDPANASGPIATIIQDLLSIVIYFSIAALVLM